MQLVREEGPTSIHRSCLLKQWGRMEDGPGQEVNILLFWWSLVVLFIKNMSTGNIWYSLKNNNKLQINNFAPILDKIHKTSLNASNWQTQPHLWENVLLFAMKPPNPWQPVSLICQNSHAGVSLSSLLAGRSNYLFPKASTKISWCFWMKSFYFFYIFGNWVSLDHWGRLFKVVGICTHL